MKVNEIDSNNKRRSCLYPMAQGAVVGAITGYGVKYLQPVTDAEKNTPEYIREMSRINEGKKVFNIETRAFLENINRNGKKTLAEDVFVKAFDGLKEGDKVGKDRFVKAYRTLLEQKPEEIPALRTLFQEAKNETERVAKYYEGEYIHVTKHIRPTSVFLIAGAVVGALIGLIKNVIQTDIKS